MDLADIADPHFFYFGSYQRGVGLNNHANGAVV